MNTSFSRLGGSSSTSTSTSSMGSFLSNTARNLNLSTNTLLILGGCVVLIIVAILFYYYYIVPATKPEYKPNHEMMPVDPTNGRTAELMFFYADWCPHCKAAKPIWNDVKSQYEHKTVNGYKLVFTEIDCSETTPEVEKLMDQYSVEGYPTIKLIKDGQIIEYDAKPSVESLTKFIQLLG